MKPEYKKAEYLGAIAWIDGLPLDANPYEPELSPTLSFYWDKGWREFDTYASDLLNFVKGDAQ